MHSIPRQLLITGTDTEVGKTFISSTLLYKARQSGATTAALKPIASGAEETAEGLRNEDALALQRQCTPALPYAQINPVLLEPAIAPHIAAAESGRRISVSQLAGLCRGVLIQRRDFTLIEGAGGWRVPLNERETLADLARALNIPVVLVVGLKLGCINHACLTAEAILNDGLPLVGWVGNACGPTPMDRLEDNLQTLRQRLPAPCLGIMPWQSEPDIESAATQLKWPRELTS
ncbi:dethiobiotin synthase [Terasakiispira papahanaumokuakeensis]|uniref:ATP-dependent dethiobiotin synthetase BioD n=1 Tax=Terasakiispira papahanaumokuakeensis TaxID=197479 RepID=A0A1E2VAP2_9GAMM|nr:dethiobiotin synthase [Terasakiispira papahanaumokuakeensis]ODC04057.1 dethiobiotin synthase [Terasakiispira papahanaumokuakeensis]